MIVKIFDSVELTIETFFQGSSAFGSHTYWLRHEAILFQVRNTKGIDNNWLILT
jgi:hypothetical protein